MNKFKQYIVGFLFVALAFNYANAQEVTVCSFNVRGSSLDTGVNAWSNRKNLVLREFANYKYDIICMQEPLLDQLEDFMTLEIYERVGLSDRGTENSNVFSPIFYNKEKFNVLEHGTFWLSPTPEKVSTGWDAKFPRICSWAKFRDIENCRVFFVFNTHLDHIGEVAKLEGAKVITTKIAKEADGEVVFITGDMNSKPGTDPILHFRFLYVDTREIADKKIGPTGTAHSFGKLIPPSQIDYIFTTPGVTVSKAETITKTAGPIFMSDHHPIVIHANF